MSIFFKIITFYYCEESNQSITFGGNVIHLREDFDQGTIGRGIKARHCLFTVPSFHHSSVNDSSWKQKAIVRKRGSEK
jgi:hypothetical protein